MSQENVEIVRRALEANARRDGASARSLYSPDIEMDFSDSPFADFMAQGSHRGVDDVENVFRDWYDAWENVETDVEELVDAGEQVISVFNYRGRGRASGVEVEFKRMAGLWTVRDGVIVRVVWLRGRDEALEAAGLSE